IDPGASTIRSAPLNSPQLPVTDLAAHRGDGIFETVLVRVDPATREPTVVSRERHFARFHSSASALDLPEPDRRLWRQAVDTVVAETIKANPGVTEFAVRYSLSRGTD
ncbi:aminotransferase PabC, partial [Burkholderia multivorans]